MTIDRPQRHESPELGAMIGRMLNALIRRAAEGDTEAVEQLGYLEALARQAHTSGLCEARRAGGYSLSELAAVTGTSRQAVSQRTANPPAELPVIAPCDHHGCVGMRRCRIGVSAQHVTPQPHTESTTAQNEVQP